MKRKLLWLFLCLSLVEFISCKKYDVPADTPDCVKLKIKENSKINNGCFIAVHQYEYNGKILYLFDFGDCVLDIAEPFRDEQCNNYFGNINSDSLIYIKLIWEK